MAPGDILAIITALLMYHIPVILKPHDGKHEKGVKILHEVIEVCRLYIVRPSLGTNVYLDRQNCRIVQADGHFCKSCHQVVSKRRGEERATVAKMDQYREIQAVWVPHMLLLV